MRWKVTIGIALCALATSACGDDPQPEQVSTSPNVTANNVAANNVAANNVAANNVAANNVAANNQTTNNATTPDCIPRRDAYDELALPFIEESCGNCHGDEPAFGAPMSLYDYDALVAGAEGERLVDKMAMRLLDRTMPPATSPALPHGGLDTLVEWATCGASHPDHTEGLQASRPVWGAPEAAPDLPFFDVTATEFAVSRTTLDRYQCFVVEAPIDEPRFIRRIEPVVDDARVLHHALVRIDRDGGGAGTNFGCGGFPPGDEYVYVWAPGQEPLQFDDGGLRIEPGQTFVLQIHYNNGAGAPDVVDSSGFRVYHGPTEGTEYGLSFLGTLGFLPISPGVTSEVTIECTIQTEVELVATWPHMHEIGSSFSQSVIRTDGTIESILDLTGWSFEAQLLYDTPFTLNPGDRLKTTCRWNNTKSFPVFPGEGTSDEMCFDFVFISPPVASFCN